MYSSTLTAILRIHPSSAQRLSVTELTDLGVSKSDKNHAQKEADETTSRLGIGSTLTGLGGYVGLGGKTIGPVGAALPNGQTLLVHDCESCCLKATLTHQPLVNVSRRREKSAERN